MAAVAVCCASQANAQTQPTPEPNPVAQPTPTEIPIGTEANAPEPPAPTISRITLPEKINFKVATWNLAASSDGKTPAVSKRKAPPQKRWRTTFGSERTTAKWRSYGTATFSVDIIALQGVDNISDIHRMFNARKYHIVASRQLLARSNATSGGIATFRADAPPTTAVAYRRRRGVRIAGFRHFLPREQRRGEPAAITAMRLRIYRKMLWIASLDLPTDCTVEMTSETCKPHAPVLENFLIWAKRTAAQSTPLLLLGSWPQSIRDKLKETGFDTRDGTTITSTCVPAPSGILFSTPGSLTAEVAELDDATAAEKNPCVAIANFAMKLR